MELLENGSVTSPRGFTAAAVAAEIKYIGRNDLTIVYSKVPAQAAAVYTLNKFKAAFKYFSAFLESEQTES